MVARATGIRGAAHPEGVGDIAAASDTLLGPTLVGPAINVMLDRMVHGPHRTVDGKDT